MLLPLRMNHVLHYHLRVTSSNRENEAKGNGNATPDDGSAVIGDKKCVIASKVTIDKEALQPSPNCALPRQQSSPLPSTRQHLRIRMSTCWETMDKKEFKLIALYNLHMSVTSAAP